MNDLEPVRVEEKRESTETEAKVVPVMTVMMLMLVVAKTTIAMINLD